MDAETDGYEVDDGTDDDDVVDGTKMMMLMIMLMEMKLNEEDE